MLITTKKGFITCTTTNSRQQIQPQQERQPTNNIGSGDSIMATLTMTYPAYVYTTMKLLPNEYHTASGTENCRSYVNLSEHYRHSNNTAGSSSNNTVGSNNPFSNNNTPSTTSSCLTTDNNKSSLFITNCSEFRSHSAEEGAFRPSLRHCFNRQGSRSYEQLPSITSVTTTASTNSHNNNENNNNKNNIDIFIRERKRETPTTSSQLASTQTNHKNQQPTKKKLPHNVAFIKNLNELKICGFYYENLNRDDSKKILRCERPGTFLLRDSSSTSSYFTLSYVNQLYDVKHLRIEYSMGQFYFYSESSTSMTSRKKSDTVLGLVELYYSHKKSPSSSTTATSIATTLNSTNVNNDINNKDDVDNNTVDVDEACSSSRTHHNTILKRPYKISTQTLKELCRITINRENSTTANNDENNINNYVDARLNSYLRLYPYNL